MENNNNMQKCTVDIKSVLTKAMYVYTCMHTGIHACVYMCVCIHIYVYLSCAQFINTYFMVEYIYTTHTRI